MKLDDAKLQHLDQQLCFPLYVATNLLGRIYRPLLDGIGLTYSQYLAMLVLWEFGTQSVGELGERLYLDSGTLTPLLKRLEAAGLVSRDRSLADQRRVDVSLTAAGRALKKKAIEVPRTLVCLTGLDNETGSRLREDMKNLVSTLEKTLAKEQAHE